MHWCLLAGFAKELGRRHNEVGVRRAWRELPGRELGEAEGSKRAVK